MANADTATYMLRRWGVAAHGRQPGRGGQNPYRRTDVERAQAERPGPGARTDLRT